MATDEDLRAVALALPEAYEHASYGGSPSYRTKPRAFAYLREELGAAVVHVGSEEEKHALIASNPEVFFTTPHYDGYAAVLVRLARRLPRGARRAGHRLMATAGTSASRAPVGGRAGNLIIGRAMVPKRPGEGYITKMASASHAKLATKVLVGAGVLCLASGAASASTTESRSPISSEIQRLQATWGTERRPDRQGHPGLSHDHRGTRDQSLLRTATPKKWLGAKYQIVVTFVRPPGSSHTMIGDQVRIDDGHPDDGGLPRLELTAASRPRRVRWKTRRLKMACAHRHRALAFTAWVSRSDLSQALSRA